MRHCLLQFRFENYRFIHTNPRLFIQKEMADERTQLLTWKEHSSDTTIHKGLIETKYIFLPYNTNITVLFLVMEIGTCISGALVYASAVPLHFATKNWIKAPVPPFHYINFRFFKKDLNRKMR